jgi:hypothetical protein
MSNQIFVDVVKGILPFVAGFVAAYFALRTYFRQKEYELVKLRYLDEGVDRIEKDLDLAFGLLCTNFKRFADNLHKTEQNPHKVFTEKLYEGFKSPEVGNFSRIAHQRVSRLIGNDSILLSSQEALAFVDATNHKLSVVFPHKLLQSMERGTSILDREGLIIDVKRQAVELNAQQSRFNQLFIELDGLAHLLETKKLSYKQVSDFKQLSAVESIPKRLRRLESNV